MARGASKRFVIDASVARSAGGEGARHPASARCRQFLIGVLQICHHVMMTGESLAEWRCHESRFSRRWLSAMFARKKVDRVSPTCPLVLRGRIQSAVLDQTDQQVMLKDAHLVEAALEADQIVVSRDNEARGAFCRAAQLLPEIGDVAWLNPEEEPDPCSWLEVGAQFEGHRLLGSWGS